MGKKLFMSEEVKNKLNQFRTAYLCPSWIIESLFGRFEIEPLLDCFASEPGDRRLIFTGFSSEKDMYSTTWKMTINLDPSLNHVVAEGWQSRNQKTKNKEIIDELVETMRNYLLLLFTHLSMSVRKPEHWTSFLYNFVLSFPTMKELLIRYYLGVSSGEIEPDEEITSILEAFYMCLDLQFRDLQTNFSPDIWPQMFSGQLSGSFSKKYEVPDRYPHMNYREFEVRKTWLRQVQLSVTESKAAAAEAFGRLIRPEIEKIVRPVEYAFEHPTSHTGRMKDSRIDFSQMTDYPICFILIKLCMLMGEAISLCHYLYPKEWSEAVSQIQWKR